MKVMIRCIKFINYKDPFKNDMMTQTKLLPVIFFLAAIVSLFAAVGISSVNAQNMTGNATGGNMTNATAGGNMTSPSPLLPPVK